MGTNCKRQFQTLASLLTIVALTGAANVAGGAVPSAASLGVVLAPGPQGLVVAGETSAATYAGLRVGDRITAVNGQRVATEAAFLNRLAMSGGAATIVVIRNGTVQTLGTPPARATSTTTTAAAARVPAPRGFAASGLINPSQMVITSQGVMHKDLAARLGLPGIPFTGSPEHSGGVTSTSAPTSMMRR
jgi:membrane-associated protease RseP (regulator of RpoE activity)